MRFARYLPGGYTFYTYDAFGRQVDVLQDADGNPTTDEDQRNTENSYNDAGQLVIVDSPEGVIRHEYDTVTGQNTCTWTGTTKANATTETDYAYDTLGRLDSVSAIRRNGAAIDVDAGTDGNQPEVTDYVYDLLGNLEQVRLPNGVISDYDYDSLNRLETLRTYKDVNANRVWDSAVDQLLAEYDYDLAADGKRSGVTEETLVDSVLEETRIDWLYDALGRLVEEDYDYDTSATTAADYVAVYKIDLVGNRVEKSVDRLDAAGIDELFTYDYDANDRLLREVKNVQGTDVGDETSFYRYGSDNLQTLQTAKTTYDGVLTTPTGAKTAETTYEYNLQGRMSQTSVDADGDGSGAAVVTEYTYDDSGIRTSQTENGVETVYLYDKQNPTGYAQILEEKNADLNVVKTYSLGLDVIAQENATVENSGVKFLLYDGHGSTRMLVDATGQPLTGQIFRYDAFGNRLDSVANSLTNLLYSGEQTDCTGLQYLRARYYNPSTGRFNRLDSFAGSIHDPQSFHKYLYVQGNPVMGIDPTGQFLDFLSAFATQMELRARDAWASIQSLRTATALQKLVSVYDTVIGSYAQIGFKAADLLVRVGPTIQRITTISGLVFVASSIQEICEEFGFVPRTGYTEFVMGASATIFSAGMSIGEITNELRGLIDPVKGTKDGRLLTGSMANKECLSRHPNYTELPFRSYTPAVEGTLEPGTQLVRFWRPGVADPSGAFTTFVEDAEGLSFAEIQRKFALPYLPTNRSFADGSGVRAVIGIAGRNYDMPGNGRQVELLEQLDFFH